MLEENARKKRRIEIRIQTHQRLIVERAANIKREWCRECGAQVDMVRLEKATALSAESLRSIGIQVNADKLHAIEMADGFLLVCIKSLME